jgi:hypothetical protein
MQINKELSGKVAVITGGLSQYGLTVVYLMGNAFITGQIIALDGVTRFREANNKR